MQYLDSWLEEKRSAYLYAIIEKNETEKVKKRLFHELALAAEGQALRWKEEVSNRGGTVPETYQPEIRTRIVGYLLRFFSVQQLRFILSAMKVRGLSAYDSIEIKSQLLAPHGGASLERRHKGLNTAGNLRAAVFGVNDGLISNMSLLLGVVGGGSSSQTIILSGIAGLLAGACSMAAGEYVSMHSQREFFEHQIALEKEELELYPEEEAMELSYIYQARGLAPAEAKAFADSMISNPEIALATLAREELGLNPQDLGSPAGAACASFFSFALGALIPLLPFLIGWVTWNLSISIFLTAISLFSIGAILSLFTNRNAFMSGFRMLFIGVVAGSLTYGIGRLVGGSLS